MKFSSSLIILLLSILIPFTGLSQETELASDSTSTADSTNTNLIDEFNDKLEEIELMRIEDSIRKAELQEQIDALKTTDNLKKEELLKQLQDIEDKQRQQLLRKKARIDSIRDNAIGYPVVGLVQDTLFMIYNRIGSLTPKERAHNISNRIKFLYEDDFLKFDSIKISTFENTSDIIYGEIIIMSISESDALWEETSTDSLANIRVRQIEEAIKYAREERSLLVLLKRIALIMLVIVIVWLLIFLIRKGHKYIAGYLLERQKDKIKDLKYKDYTFINSAQLNKIILGALKVTRWLIVLIVLYIALPIIFSIFPFTRGWANSLFNLVWTPFSGMLTSLWNFFPNLISIIVIYILMRYAIKAVRYIFKEIQYEKLKLSGFHADWAMPTFNIVRFMLYAFMVVLIFPYLPGSDSDVFKGVSVFIGVLFSLGSSSAIANMIAGLVITYMRPFKIGDRIRIGEVTGDVMEKTTLVTRIKTIKNEEITIPNATVLNSNTINYSAHAQTDGLILNTTVTIGYDIHWRDVQQALIDAAVSTTSIENTPAPFVLQTSLDDFYISYQINAYTKNPQKQAIIYSELHQKIQDIFMERGIEIMSPHYRAERDGNASTIPAIKTKEQPDKDHAND